MKNIALKNMGKLVKGLFVSGFMMLSSLLSAQPAWSFDAADFAHSGQIDAIVLINSTEVNTGYLGAFVGSECRGYAEGLYFAPSGKTVFSLLIYSNVSSGEVISFKYYDDVNDLYYPIEETVVFVSDMIVGDALDPVNLNTISNSAPVANCPDKTELAAAPGPIYFDLCSIFSDPDGDELTFGEEHSAGSSVNWLSACELELTTAASGTSTLTLTASDGSLSASCAYSFTINPANNPPVIDQALGLLKLQEGFGTKQIDLDTIFSDPDGNNLNYSVSVGNSSVIAASVSGSTLTITEVAAGNSTLSVTATDGSESVTDNSTVIIIANGPALPWNLDVAQYTYSGEINAVVKINGAEVTSGTIGAFVGDECRGIVTGNYFPVSGRTIFTLMVYSNLSSGEYLTFRYYNDISTVVYQIEEVLAFSSDMLVGDALSPYNLTISLGNNMPLVVTPVPDQSLDEHFGTRDIDLTGRYSDPDNDVLSYQASSSNTSVATVSVSGNTLKITEKGIGTSTINVRASDGALCIDDRFALSVNNVNDPPVISHPVADQTLLEGFGSKNISLSGVFYDPDGTALSYSASSSNTGVVTVAISGGNLVITEKGNGSSTVSLCVSDGVNSVCDEILVTVVNVNDPPEADCASLGDQYLVVGFGSTEAGDLCAVFSDPDNDVLTYTVTSSNTSVVSGSVNDCVLTINEAGAGQAELTVCASDGEYSVCCSITVYVQEVNIIDVYMDERQLYDTDTIELCSTDTSFILIVYSNLEWGISSSASWLGATKANKYNATITTSANTSGVDRSGVITISDAQLNEVNIVLYQYYQCKPNAVEQWNAASVKCYPNPVNDYLNLSFENTSLEGEIEIKLVDVLGMVHRIEKANVSSTSVINLDMSGLSEGSWFIIINGAGMNETLRIPVILLK